ncbi:MAG: hypothetical protein UU12_C0035G0007, partial [Candidatus Woesebacteria bacterium GW2011_GWA2_40_7b]
PVDENMKFEIKKLAVRAFGGLQHKDYAKFDIRVDSNTGIPYFTDSNPNTAFGPDKGLPMTEVMNLNGIEFSEVLASLLSKYGKSPGYRGLILLEVEGKIKYFMLRRTDKFPIGETVYETIGTYIKYEGGKLVNMPKVVEDVLKRELFMKDLVIKRFIDLGQMHTDPAVVPTSISLYAAVIDITDSPNLKKIESRVIHAKPIQYKLLIEPIDKLKDYVNKVDESYFLACILRLVSMGVINLQ